MTLIPRVALFADTFHETNGAANVLRRLTEYARQNGFPLLCIRAGEKTQLTEDGSVQFLDLKKGRASILIDTELKYDPLLWRYKKLVTKTVKDFAPDILHVTGFNDISLIGFYLAHFQKINAVASWHTNGHEYAAKRLTKHLTWLPGTLPRKIGNLTEQFVLHGSMKLLFLAQMQLAPNIEQVEQLRKMTKRPSFLMGRGVDTEFLDPAKRDRTDDEIVIGYVGRLQAEKNVRVLAELERRLKAANIANYRFLLVGDGAERDWLAANMDRVEFTGALSGEELARNFAYMDLFVFPSKTDAFGNVVLEAMASGVPSIVTPDAGPKYLVNNGITGLVAADDEDLFKLAIDAVKDPEKLRSMGVAARSAAMGYSWQSIFEGVYEKYSTAMTYKKSVRASEDDLKQ